MKNENNVDNAPLYGHDLLITLSRQSQSKFLFQDVRLLVSQGEAGISPILAASRGGHTDMTEHILHRVPEAVGQTDQVPLELIHK